MLKNTTFIKFFGIMAFSIFFITATSYSDQYYDQYSGVGFVPDEETADYKKYADSGTLQHNDTDDMYYYCPVNFNVPDGSVHFIKSIGMRYKDNITYGEIWVYLKRENLYTGAIHTVAMWTSGNEEASDSFQTASQGTIDGRRLVDSKKFTYWLHAYFLVDGAVNPSNKLMLTQVRIHYGT